MPELPEVETIRGGIAAWATGRRISRVDVLHPRAVRRHTAGAGDFADRLTGRTINGARRRGKYLWLPLDSGDAVLCHLGMSGQLLIKQHDAPDEPHLRVRLTFDADRQLRFVDQRTFGHMLYSVDGSDLPEQIAHIAPDVFDTAFSETEFIAALRRRNSDIKRALLDQSLISGIGNIYADEALWRAKLRGTRRTDRLTTTAVTELLTHVRAVLSDALGSGGTSFDALYVNTNGESGYFARSLNVYGRDGQPCRRCAATIRRERFMNRSSYYCPTCQRPGR